MNIFALLSFLSALLIFILGIFVFEQNRKGPENFIFLLLCTVASYWAFTNYMFFGAESFPTAFFWMKLTALWTFVPPLAFHFIILFTRQKIAIRSKWVYLFLYAPALAFCWIELTSGLIITVPVWGPLGYNFGFSPDPFLPFIESVWAICLGFTAALLCLAGYFSTNDPRQKNQILFVLAGISITILVATLFQIMRVLDIAIPDLTSVSFLGFTGFVGYAIWRYHLFILNPATVADNILATMTDGLVILDTSGNIVHVNQAFCTMLEYPKEECIGRPISDIVFLEPVATRITRLLDSRESLSDFETDLWTGGGKAMPVSVSASVIWNTDGTIAGIVSVLRDITERREMQRVLARNEKWYRTLFEHTGAATIIIEHDGTIGQVNAEVAALTGYSREEIEGKMNWRQFVHPDDFDLIQRNHRDRLLDPAATPAAYTIRIRDRHGTILTLRTMVAVLPGTTRSIVSLVDISELKRTGDALALVNKKLNLLSSITRHDIINRLMIVKAYLVLLQENIADPALQEYIDRGADAARTIEEQILFTRHYQDMGVREPVWQNLRGTIVNAKGALPTQGIAIDVTSPDYEIYADPLFEKVFYNLIDNSLHYGGKDMRHIHVSSEETNGGLAIAYEDDGAGIAEEDRSRLFEQGFGKHTGLGLFLSREILSITGITIREAGVPGKGARFEIVVPRGLFRRTAEE